MLTVNANKNRKHTTANEISLHHNYKLKSVCIHLSPGCEVIMIFTTVSATKNHAPTVTNIIIIPLSG